MVDTSKVIKNTAVIISCVLVLTVLICAGNYFFVNPEFDLFSSLSGLAALAVAFLTVAYVVTTSQQLSVMNQQLIEIRKSRELVDQPLPFIKIINPAIIKPRFYYTPPREEYTWQSLYKFEYQLSNISNYPAVNICVYPSLILGNEANVLSLNGYGHFFEIIKQEATEKKLFFSDDLDGRLIKEIVESKRPKLIVRILFKNILGACFACEHHFNIILAHPKDYDNFEEIKAKRVILRKWYKNIVEFSKIFKNELINVNKLTPYESQEWTEQFEKMKKRFEELNPGDEELPIQVFVDSAKYSITIIDSDAYEREVESKKITKKLKKRTVKEVVGE
jgi:hypothetical protein